MSAAAVMALGRKKQPMSQTALPRLVQVGILLPYCARLRNVTGYGSYYIEDSGDKASLRKIPVSGHGKPAKKTGTGNNLTMNI